MNKYFRRLYMKTDNQFFNPFLHAFILKTLVFGIFFTFLSETTSISETNLYRLTSNYLPTGLGNLWGIALLLVVLGHILEMLFRGKGFGPVTGVAGFMLWLYAGCVYLSTGQWFAFTGIVALDLFVFWPWYYFSAKTYKEQLESNKISHVL